MLSNAVSTIGVMFDSHRDDPFPRLADVSYSWAGEQTDVAYVGSLSDWFVVASNPYRVTYFDEDSRAMDETNITAVLSSFLELDAPEDADEYDPAEDDEEANAEGRRPIYAYGRVYLVRPDDEAAISLAQGFVKFLSDYPLLDESSYCEREYNSWLDYVDNGLQSDTMRDLDALDEDTADALDDAWSDVAPAAAENLHDYNGWDGSHSPDFAECIGTAVASAIGRVLSLSIA